MHLNAEYTAADQIRAINVDQQKRYNVHGSLNLIIFGFWKIKNTSNHLGYWNTPQFSHAAATPPPTRRTGRKAESYYMPSPPEADSQSDATHQ